MLVALAYLLPAIGSSRKALTARRLTVSSTSGFTRSKHTDTTTTPPTMWGQLSTLAVDRQSISAPDLLGALAFHIAGADAGAFIFKAEARARPLGLLPALLGLRLGLQLGLDAVFDDQGEEARQLAPVLVRKALGSVADALRQP